MLHDMLHIKSLNDNYLQNCMKLELVGSSLFCIFPFGELQLLRHPKSSCQVVLPPAASTGTTAPSTKWPQWSGKSSISTAICTPSIGNQILLVNKKGVKWRTCGSTPSHEYEYSHESTWNIMEHHGTLFASHLFLSGLIILSASATLRTPSFFRDNKSSPSIVQGTNQGRHENASQGGGCCHQHLGAMVNMVTGAWWNSRWKIPKFSRNQSWIMLGRSLF